MNNIRVCLDIVIGGFEDEYMFNVGYLTRKLVILKRKSALQLRRLHKLPGDITPIHFGKSQNKAFS